MSKNNPRAKADFYPSPPEATIGLLSKIKFQGDILEPACGNGAIAKLLNNVVANDLYDYGYGNSGIDFLTYNKKHDNIITNPPYNLALEFVLHSKELANKKIAMLLRTAFLESAKRYEMFKDKQFPLEYVLQFSKRLTMTPNGIKMKNSGMCAYAWFVWNKDYSGEPKIDWIL